MDRSHLKLSALALAIGLALSAHATAGAGLAGQGDAIARLSSATGRAPQVSYHSATGAARFVRLEQAGKQLGLARSAKPASDDDKQQGAAQFLSDYGSMFGISNVATELSAGQMAKDKHGGAHITHKQVYRGVPVFGAELKSHFDAAGNLTAVNGTFVPGIELNTQPSRSAAEAASAAKKMVTAELSSSVAAKVGTAAPTLMVYREGLAKGVEGANRLVWQVEVGNGVDVREFVYVDAHSGKVVDRIAGIHDSKNRRAFDAQNATQPGPNYPGTPFWVEGQGFPTGTVEADNMISASGEIYDLFKTAFGRDSFDGKGATMDSIFNRGNGCPNASWNGQYISFCPGTTTDDVTAHEWGHAYTQYTHGLIYAWQPGALNEAYSDIWGETVDRLNGRGTDTPDAARTEGSCTVFTTTAPKVTISAPAAIAGSKSAGAASFGATTFNIPATGVVVVNDGVGTSTDGCEAPFVNAAAVSGKIAFMDRGTCAFTIKVKNAQNAGAIGVIIGDNSGGNSVAGMSGADATITIASLRISQNNGTAIKSNAGVVAALKSGGPGTDNSVRWLMGEDSSAFSGAIRDMYNPTCYSNPGKVSDTQYSCGPNTQAGDNGGVHSNSGVPNHAYALLVDGGSYNGQSITAIGLTKAAHIYYRAQSVYQGPASGFPEHADAIEQSCRDLKGVNLTHLKTGLPSGEVITTFDCDQVANAAKAVELRTAPSQCGFTTLLQQSPPPLCPAGSPSVIAADGFDGGRRASMKWTMSNGGVDSAFIPRNFGVVTKLPSGRAGYAMYAADIDAGNCSGPGSQAGLQRLESPEIAIPAGATTLRMSFDHWVSTEAGWDGGNLKISVNGGAWQLVSAANFVYNPYNGTLNTPAQGNDNPLAGQAAFTGGDGGSVGGSWGRSIINLAPYAVPGDKVKIRFELSNDCGGGALGWYLDDVSVYSCATPAP